MARTTACLFLFTMVLSFAINTLPTNAAAVAPGAIKKKLDLSNFPSPDCQFMRLYSSGLAIRNDLPSEEELETCPLEGCFIAEASVTEDCEFESFDCESASIKITASDSCPFSSCFMDEELPREELIDELAEDLVFLPPCFAPFEISANESRNEASLPDSLFQSTCPFECCFVTDESVHSPVVKTNVIESTLTDEDAFASLHQKMNFATPIFIGVLDEIIRIGAVVVENSHYVQRHPNPLRGDVSAITVASPIRPVKPTISLPAHREATNELPAPHINLPEPMESLDPVKPEVMDSYWQYYEDCDRWDIQFGNEPAADRVASTMRSQLTYLRVSKYLELVRPLFRCVKERVQLVDLGWVTQVSEVWQMADFHFVKTTFAGFLSSDPAESVAKEKGRSQIK